MAAFTWILIGPQFKIQIVVDEENGKIITEELFALDKTCDGDGLVGLSLSESERLLKKLQQIIVLQQTSQYTASHRCCPHCDKKRRIKGSYDIQFRTLFGIIAVPNARLYHCKCEETNAKTFGVLNDWLSDHNSPKLQYIETKWASLMSYGMTVDLLKEVLPVNNSLDAETVRRHLHKTAARQDEQLKDQPRFISGCQNQWAKPPRPVKPLTVGIDGGYVRDLQQLMHPEAEHILDWFHVAMRLTVLNQYAKGGLPLRSRSGHRTSQNAGEHQMVSLAREY